MAIFWSHWYQKLYHVVLYTYFIEETKETYLSPYSDSMGFNQSKRPSLYSDKHGGVKVKIFCPQNTNFGPKMFFSCSCLLLYRSYVPLCKRGIIPSRYYLVKVRLKYVKIAWQGAKRKTKGYEIEVIMLPTQHPVTMVQHDHARSTPKEALRWWTNNPDIPDLNAAMFYWGIFIKQARYWNDIGKMSNFFQ